MTKTQAIQYFGSVRALADALGIKAVQSVYEWPEDGIPEGRQFQIQVLTKGKLKASEQKPLRAEKRLGRSE